MAAAAAAAAETYGSSAHKRLTGVQVRTTVTGNRWEATCLAVARLDVGSVVP